MTTNVVYFRTDGDRALFFRGVDAAEYADWKAHGVLRGIPGGMAFGKHLATTPAHAIAWRCILPTAGDHDPPRVLRVSFPLAVAYRLFCLGPRIDGIGPAYFAEFEELKAATIDEVQP